MKKLQTLSKILISIALPLIMLTVVFLAVGVAAGDRAWLEREYEKLDINDYTGMSTDDMIKAFMQMVDYMKGDTSTMDVTVTVNGEKTLMYNEREVAHMRDVRALYKTLTAAKYCVIALTVITAALALAAFRTKDERREVLRFTAKAALIAFGVIFALVIALGAWAMLDFNSLWEAFHIVFLDLESSTFDPAVSRMIRICPAELFSDMVMRIGVWSFAADLLIALAAAAYLIASKKRKLKA